MKKILIAGVLTAVVSTVSMGSASAAKPRTQACLGQSVSALAQADGNYAQTFVLPYTSGGIGFEVQLVQAGAAPDGIYPNSCND